MFVYFFFDVDLEDKFGFNIVVMVRNVIMIFYGSVYFMGNSVLILYKYVDMSFGNKFFISFKFKFDCWLDSLDYVGKIIYFFMICLLYFILLLEDVIGLLLYINILYLIIYKFNCFIIIKFMSF